MKELESFEAELSEGTLEQARKYTKDPCVHAGRTTASDCIRRLVGKKNLKKLFVATQDKELRKVFRNMAAVPLVYFKHGIMTLDPPSEATLVKAERVSFSQKEKIKLKFEPAEKKSLKGLLEQVKVEEKEKKVRDRMFVYKDKERNKMKIELGKKRKAKGPNPLSVKKKKVEKVEGGSERVKKTRRGRKGNKGEGEGAGVDS